MNLISNINYSIRQILKQPGFAIAVVLTLALGIGANSAIFSMINGMMLQPLPYPDSEDLVMIHNTYPMNGLDTAGVSIPDYVDRRDRTDSFESTALFTWEGMNLTSTDQPRRLLVLRTTPSLFDVLRTSPMLGAPLSDAHTEPGNDRAAVLSHALWQSAFGGSEDIVGETIQLDGTAYNVEGVMPASFVFPNQDIQIWVPFAFTEEQLSNDERGREYSMMIARLAPGSTIEQAQSQVDRIHEINREMAPAEITAFWENSGFGGRVTDYRKELIGDLAQPLWLLQIAVALVLVIACANVANLMLARVTARQGELNIRSALGAGRRRLVGQLLTESMLLSLAGAVVGIGVAYAGLQFMIATGLGSSNALFDVQLDASVLVFTLGLGLLTGVVFGVFPALSAAGADTAATLKESGRTTTGSKGAGVTRSGLVVAQVAIAAVLLVGSGLLILSFAKLQDTNPGFNAEGVLTASLSMPENDYATTAAVQDFHDRLIGRLGAIPGVTAVGMTNTAPFGGGNSQASYDIEGYTPPPGVNAPHGMIRRVDGGYFEALQIPLLRGRLFEPADDSGNPPAIIDEVLAEKYFSDVDPIGRRIGFDDEENPQWFSVVGVVGAVKHEGLAGTSEKETYYLPFRQSSVSGPTIVIRTAVNPASVIAQLREAVHAVDPELPLGQVQTMQELIDVSLQVRRAPMLLLIVFSVVALALSAVGLYGVLAYSITQRTSELGMRIALGARMSDITTLVLRQSGLLVAIGIGLGLVAAVGLTRLIENQLYGIDRLDPMVFGGVALFLAIVAIAACLLPARRAARVDPIEALHHQ